MSPFITKVLTVSGLLGGAGGLIYASTYYLNGYTLGEKLKDKGHELLNYKTNDNSDKADWAPILKAYSDSGAKLGGKEIKLASTDPTETEINKLKELCASATSSRSYSQKDGLLTEQYCVKTVTIIQLLHKDKNKRILDWSVDDNRDDGIWNSRVTEYKGIESSKKVENLKLDASGSGSEKTNRDSLKNWCKGFEGDRTINENYHTKYGQFIKWCVV